MNWYELDRPEKLRLVRLYSSQGLNSKEIGELLGCPPKTIQSFRRTWNIKGLNQGAQPNNTSAQFHGESKNKIRRIMRETVLNDGRSLTICERCNWTERQNLPIHHKDRDRGNNDPSNLEVLCHECHAKEHNTERLRNEYGQFAD